MKAQLTFFLMTASLVLLSANLQAQSMQVIGGSAFATTCYQDSVAASRLGSAEFSNLENCNKAIEYGNLKKPDLIATYVNRGILYAVMGNLNKAAKDYTRAIDMSGDVAETYLNRGNLWFMVNRFQDAIADYDKAQELELRQIHILFLNRGMAYESLGLLNEAEENYLASLNVVPDWMPAVEKLERVGRKKSELEAGS